MASGTRAWRPPQKMSDGAAATRAGAPGLREETANRHVKLKDFRSQQESRTCTGTKVAIERTGV
jgi:hypothetical protein